MRRASVQMPFGKWRGHRLDALPDDYLAWLRTCPLRPRLRAHVEAEHARRLGSAGGETAPPGPTVPPELRPIAERIVTAGYRGLAKQLHPDHGGDGAQMRELNAAMSVLRRLIGQGRPWAVGQ